MHMQNSENSKRSGIPLFHSCAAIETEVRYCKRMIIVVFGFPGSGKTFVGQILSKQLGYFYYDGDNCLTEGIKEAVQKKKIITDAMRDMYFTSLSKEVKELQKTHQNIVITQTFIKEKYRKQFLQHFPDTQFILVKTQTPKREERLEKRKTFPIDLEYARAMCYLFEPPTVPYETINNDVDGKKIIKIQISQLSLRSRVHRGRTNLNGIATVAGRDLAMTEKHKGYFY